MSLIYLVRHGESEANTKGLIGTPDAVLSKKGIKQAQAVGRQLKNAKIQQIYVSKYQRTKQTAYEMMSQWSKPLTPLALTGIHERDFGKLSLKRPQTTLKKLKRVLDQLSKEERAELKFSNDMETDLEAFKRMNNALIIIAKKDSVAAVVSHSNILRIFLVYNNLRDFETYPAGSIKNGEIIKIVFKRNRFYLN